VPSLLRFAAVLASAIVLLGFAAFAADEASRASSAQLSRLADGPAERARERSHGPLREALDDANDVLLGPFEGLSSSRDPWVRRGVPALVALLVYGLGLTLAANYLPRRRPRGSGDWRTA